MKTIIAPDRTVTPGGYDTVLNILIDRYGYTQEVRDIERLLEHEKEIDFLTWGDLFALLTVIEHPITIGDLE